MPIPEELLRESEEMIRCGCSLRNVLSFVYSRAQWDELQEVLKQDHARFDATKSGKEEAVNI